jgi:hypothetical protein
VALKIAFTINVDLATARRLHADARGLPARDIDSSADRKEKRAPNAHTYRAAQCHGPDGIQGFMDPDRSALGGTKHVRSNL